MQIYSEVNVWHESCDIRPRSLKWFVRAFVGNFAVQAAVDAPSLVTAPLIAVVDDDALILKMLRYYLLSAGYRVVTWTRATGAASMIAREQPALVILDMRMERDRAGLDVLRMLRTRRETASIPVLFVSAWADDLTTDEWDEIRAAHAEIMMKPFEFADLIGRMHRMIAPGA